MLFRDICSSIESSTHKTEVKPRLRLLTETEKSMKDRGNLQYKQLKKIVEDFPNEREVCEAHAKYAQYCDGVYPDILPRHLPNTPPKSSDLWTYIIKVYQAFEKDFIDRKRKDPFYSASIAEENYEPIRVSLKFPARNDDVNTSVFTVYPAICDKIVSFFSDENKVRSFGLESFSVRDGLDIITKYAWDSFKSRATREMAPGFHDPIWLPFFQKMDILSDNAMFENTHLEAILAAVGFCEENYGYSPDEFFNRFHEIFELLSEVLINAPIQRLSRYESWSPEAVSFGCYALFYAAPPIREEAIHKICAYLDHSLGGEKRASNTSYTIILNCLLVQPDCLLSSSVMRTMLDSLFRRTLLPQQMYCAGGLTDNYFVSRYLKDQFNVLDDPDEDENGFGSPYYAYLYTNTKVAELLAMNSGDQNSAERTDTAIQENPYFTVNQQMICLKAGAVPEQVMSHDDVLRLYRACAYVQGVTWRLSNVQDAQGYKVSGDVFQTVGRKCLEVMRYKGLETPAPVILGAQLLLTGLSNTCRNKFLAEEETLDHNVLVDLAICSDTLQRRRNKDYQKYLSNPSSETSFWLISGSFRCFDLYEFHWKGIATKRVELSDEDCDLYILALTKELYDSKRFFVLITRMLEKHTNFFELLKNREGMLEGARAPTLNADDMRSLFGEQKQVGNHFLPYDHIDDDGDNGPGYVTDVYKREGSEAPPSLIKYLMVRKILSEKPTVVPENIF